MKIIPIFVPHAGCPYRCIYCDQKKISGANKIPSAAEIHSIIDRNLKTIPKGEKVEIAFFGGTFTFLPERLQEKYLAAVYPFGKTLRMSTHPETISLEAMKRFKNNRGRLVELGIQSLDKEVLRKIKRPVNPSAIKNAAACIKKAGLGLGVQVMLGLPGDTLERSIKTARELVKLKPQTARIYPTLVIKGTELALLYKKGKYRPLSLEDAVREAAEVADVFEEGGVKVIRIGLHPSKDLDSKNTMLVGPYHPAFGEMVRSRQMRNKIIGTVQVQERHVANRSHIEVIAPKNMLNIISGHKKAERKFLEKYFGAPVVLRGGTGLKIKDIRKDIIVVDPRMPSEAKAKLEELNYYVAETSFHKRLPGPVKGHPDMMLFEYKGRVIYEPRLENIAELLRQNGYRCTKGQPIVSSKYPKDIIYNACNIGGRMIRYKGDVEGNIKKLKARHVLINQGYAKCSIVPVDAKHIITSDKDIKEAWEKSGGKALLIRPGYIKLPGYKTGFIGGASGSDEKRVFFVGRLDSHPDCKKMRGFIKRAGKGIIELYDGPLYDVGTALILPCESRAIMLYWNSYERKRFYK